MQGGAAGGSEALGGTAYLRLVGIGAAIGIPAALVAAGFLALVHWLEHQLWTDLPKHLGYSTPPWYLVIGVPAAGAVVVFGRGGGDATPAAVLAAAAAWIVTMALDKRAAAVHEPAATSEPEVA